MQNNLFIISGPSGAGEDSVIDGLKKFLPIERVVTTTTRGMRSGECDGDPYYFISREAFQKKIASGEFAEYATEYNGNLYGVTNEELARVQTSSAVGIWKIEWKGVIAAKNMFPGIIAILITVSDLSVLEERIRRRNPNINETYLRERQQYTEEWMKHINLYDFIVYNEDGKLDAAIREVKEIIEKTWVSFKVPE